MRRQNAHRDGCLCCYTHKNFKSYEFSKGSWLNKAFGFIGSLLLKRGVQILILSATAAFLAGGLWGTSQLQQEYQPQVIYIFIINPKIFTGFKNIFYVVIIRFE